MWRIECYRKPVYNVGGYRPFYVGGFKSYKEACKFARGKVCSDVREIAIFKVGGCPLRHHIDGTKTTLYTWDESAKRPIRWFW